MPKPGWANPDLVISLVKKDIPRWVFKLERQVNGKFGGFPFSAEKNNYTLLSTCFAVLLLELLGTLKEMKENDPDRVGQWVRYIQSFQKNDGHFVDQEMLKSGYKTAAFSGEYIDWQQTYFACHALDALGVAPAHPLGFLRPWLDKNYLSQWLQKISLKKIWFESNRLMWLMYFFYKTGHPELIDRVLDWLDSIQDPKTGYYGTAHGADLWTGMGGAFHLYMFYFYRKRPLRYLNKIIDSTLKLQLPEGSFLPVGGGACVDLDAIDILVNISQRTPYRHKDVMSALRLAQQSILNQKIPGGVFAESIGRDFGISDFISMIYQAIFQLHSRLVLKKYFEKFVKIKLSHKSQIRYSSFFQAQYDMRQGDIWSAWFRTLALALINQAYPRLLGSSGTWKFRSEPGLGYYLPTHILHNEDYTGERAETSAPQKVISNLKKRYGIILKEIRPADQVLDYGCGSGIGTKMLLGTDAKIDAFDIDTQAISRVKKIIAPNRRFSVLGSVSPIKKNTYDKIACLEVIEHLPRNLHIELIKKLFSYLKDGGILYFSTPINYGTNGTYYSTNPYHLYEYSFPEIWRLLEKFGNISFWNAGESFGFRIQKGTGQKLSRRELVRKGQSFFWQMAKWRWREKKYRKSAEYLVNWGYSLFAY